MLLNRWDKEQRKRKERINTVAQNRHSPWERRRRRKNKQNEEEKRYISIAEPIVRSFISTLRTA